MSKIVNLPNGERSDRRAHLKRLLAELLVDLREHDAPLRHGMPDWEGKTFAYREMAREVYAPAREAWEERRVRALMGVVGNVVSVVLRERAPADDLEALGMDERSARERHRDTMRQISETAREVKRREMDIDAMRALGAAAELLDRVDPDELIRVRRATRARARRYVEKIVKALYPIRDTLYRDGSSE